MFLQYIHYIIDKSTVDRDLWCINDPSLRVRVVLWFINDPSLRVRVVLSSINDPRLRARVVLWFINDPSLRATVVVWSINDPRLRAKVVLWSINPCLSFTLIGSSKETLVFTVYVFGHMEHMKSPVITMRGEVL